MTEHDVSHEDWSAVAVTAIKLSHEKYEEFVALLEESEQMTLEQFKEENPKLVALLKSEPRIWKDHDHD